MEQLTQNYLLEAIHTNAHISYDEYKMDAQCKFKRIEVENERLMKLLEPHL